MKDYALIWSIFILLLYISVLFKLIWPKLFLLASKEIKATLISFDQFLRPWNKKNNYDQLGQ